MVLFAHIRLMKLFNKFSNIQITVLYISHFTFIITMGKQAKLFPWMKKFVCQHKMSKDCEPAIWHVHHILHRGHGERKNFIINLQLRFWKVFPAIFRWPQEVNFPSCFFSGWKWDLKHCKICTMTFNNRFLYFSIQWENSTLCFKTELPVLC